MNLPLPSDVRSIIEAKVASGEFSSEAEVVAAGVRLLQLDEKAERERQADKLRRMLQEAIDEIQRGDFLDVDEAFDDVEVELFGKRLADA